MKKIRTKVYTLITLSLLIILPNIVPITAFAATEVDCDEWYKYEEDCDLPDVWVTDITSDDESITIKWNSGITLSGPEFFFIRIYDFDMDIDQYEWLYRTKDTQAVIPNIFGAGDDLTIYVYGVYGSSMNGAVVSYKIPYNEESEIVSINVPTLLH